MRRGASPPGVLLSDPTMIISVHLPKTAGKSFEAALRTRFEGALLEDYGTFPMNTPPLQRCRAALQASLANVDASFAGVECIHGHFLPLKYLLLSVSRELTFVTWVRHPVQRMISNYHYWQRTYEAATARPLHRRMVEEQWSLERFCLGDEMRNMYSHFLWGFPVDNFAFIGVTEHYDEDLAYFAQRYLGGPVPSQRLNVGSAAGQEYEIDPGLRRRVEAFHARDMALYDHALESRAARPPL